MRVFIPGRHNARTHERHVLLNERCKEITFEVIGILRPFILNDADWVYLISWCFPMSVSSFSLNIIGAVVIMLI